MNKKTTMLLKLRKFYFFIILFFYSIFSFGQLGFCNGSSGAPIFLENFGSGTNYGPALPAGVTNYTFVNSGFPQDGQYTLYNRTNLIPNNWHTSFDRTPDNEPDGINGKCLIVNASNTPGQFYRRTVTGLCSNTRFEFSAWLINIYNSASGACPGSGIPINVTFEIWDETDTTLLRSGNTGNIAGTPNPIWNQFGLVFTMPAGQTSVILKMRNNGGGGCGNDLAIDDIMFRACGENSSIINTSSSGNTLTICQNSNITNPNLEVVTTGSISHVYQWQQSNDNINFTDISGENSANFTIPNITSTTYYRVKVAQDITNLNNPFCSTFSDIYSVVIIPSPDAPTSNGDQRICSNQATSLSVSILGGQIVNWYDSPTNGNLLLANSTTYTPTNIGTYYAETVSLLNGCKSNTRTAVTLLPAISVTSSGPTTFCTNTNTTITLVSSDVNATLNWTATSTDVTGFSNGSGTSINQTLQYDGTTSGTVTYVVTPILNGCEGNPETIVVTVTPATTINLVFPPITTTYCLNATPEILPTLSSNTTPITGTWSPSVINTSSVGTTTYTFTPQVGSCQNILPYQINITVNNTISPDFNASIFFCSGTTPPTLNTTSPNGISGTWSPATIDNFNSGSYLFTPNPNQCANTQTINVTVGTNNTTISYNGPTTICANQTTAINLVASDPNATLNWTATSTDVTGFSDGSGTSINQTLQYNGTTSGTVTYEVTPILNGCEGNPETIVVTVTPVTTINIVFSPITTTYCLNATPEILPTLSSNTTPITGTWSPSVINTSSVGTTTYTFTPQVGSCQNILPYQINITVGNNLSPDFPSTISLCSGEIAPILTNISPNGISGTWSPAVINNLVSGSYTFTPNLGSCTVPQTINVTILESQLESFSYSISGAFTDNQSVTISAIPSGNYNYQLDNGALQESNIFENVSPGIHTISVIDSNTCGYFLSEEILIINYPNYFTPNNHGINDFWYISGMNIFENWKISIFDRFGKLITQLNPSNIAWNGTFKSNELPSTDYWFLIEYQENGISRTFRSHFSLIR